jgi:hypothetical protein
VGWERGFENSRRHSPIRSADFAYSAAEEQEALDRQLDISKQEHYHSHPPGESSRKAIASNLRLAKGKQRATESEVREMYSHDQSMAPSYDEMKHKGGVNSIMSDPGFPQTEQPPKRLPAFASSPLRDPPFTTTRAGSIELGQQGRTLSQPIRGTIQQSQHRELQHSTQPSRVSGTHGATQQSKARVYKPLLARHRQDKAERSRLDEAEKEKKRAKNIEVARLSEEWEAEHSSTGTRERQSSQLTASQKSDRNTTEVVDVDDLDITSGSSTSVTTTSIEEDSGSQRNNSRPPPARNAVLAQPPRNIVNPQGQSTRLHAPPQRASVPTQPQRNAANTHAQRITAYLPAQRPAGQTQQQTNTLPAQPQRITIQPQPKGNPAGVQPRRRERSPTTDNSSDGSSDVIVTGHRRIVQQVEIEESETSESTESSSGEDEERNAGQSRRL